jgi:SAM-dependent methyltransferase
MIQMAITMQETRTIRIQAILFSGLALFLLLSAVFSQDDHHSQPSPERVFYFERQEVHIQEFDVAGPILDLGGGGEGVIGKLKDGQVVAIDISKRELEAAPEGPLKIVMDATDLKFLDASFNLVTACFTMMYIPEEDHQRVIEEAYRVLKRGGHLRIWDVVFPTRIELKKDIAVFPMSIKLPKEEIETGYGARWPANGRDTDHYAELARSVGFKVVELLKKDQWFLMRLEK